MIVIVNNETNSLSDEALNNTETCGNPNAFILYKTKELKFKARPRLWVQDSRQDKDLWSKLRHKMRPRH